MAVSSAYVNNKEHAVVRYPQIKKKMMKTKTTHEEVGRKKEKSSRTLDLLLDPLLHQHPRSYARRSEESIQGDGSRDGSAGQKVDIWD